MRKWKMKIMRWNFFLSLLSSWSLSSCKDHHQCAVDFIPNSDFFFSFCKLTTAKWWKKNNNFIWILFVVVAAVHCVWYEEEKIRNNCRLYLKWFIEINRKRKKHSENDWSSSSFSHYNKTRLPEIWRKTSYYFIWKNNFNIRIIILFSFFSTPNFIPMNPYGHHKIYWLLSFSNFKNKHACKRRKKIKFKNKTKMFCTLIFSLSSLIYIQIQ